MIWVDPGWQPIRVRVNRPSLMAHALLIWDFEKELPQWDLFHGHVT